MDVVSGKKVNRLVAAYGTTRIYELDDKTWVTAEQGTVSWRNNNPGNLKFEFAGSADTTHAHGTKDKALAYAQKSYDGVVDLDQHGNIVFESYEAGRAAQKQYIVKQHPDDTVEQLVRAYSKPDYSGAVHYDAQARAIYAKAMAEGHDLHGKTVTDMTPDERSALLDGISHFESWKAGTVTPTPVMTEEQVATLKAAHPVTHPAPAAHAAEAHGYAGHANVHKQGDYGAAVGALQGDLAALGFTAREGSPIRTDQHFGPHTKEAVEAFQTAHGLRADGMAGPATLSAISEARTHAQAMPTLLDARHPANGMYEQAYACVVRLDEAQGRAAGPHTQAFAGSLTSAATAAGFDRIDHVVLSDDASRGWAVQGQLNSPFKQYTEVNVMQAIQTPLAQSSQEAAVHVQNNVQQQAQAQQQTQNQAQQAGPSVVR